MDENLLGIEASREPRPRRRRTPVSSRKTALESDIGIAWHWRCHKKIETRQLQASYVGIVQKETFLQKRDSLLSKKIHKRDQGEEEEGGIEINFARNSARALHF